MVTMERALDKQEKIAVRSGSTFMEKLTLGLYAPEFSSKRSEVDLELVFDKGTV